MLKVATQGSGDAMVLVSRRGRAKEAARARTPRRSRYPEVAPGRTDPAVQAQDRYVAPDALASATEATRQHRSVSLEEPGACIKHETPGHPSRDVFRQATLRTADYDSTVSRAAKLLSDRLGDGHGYSPASCDARAVLKTHCAFSTRNALTARTKQYGLTSRSTVRRPALWILALLQRGQLTCLPSSPAMGNQGCKLPAQCRNDKLRCRRWVARNGGKREGLSALAHGPHDGPPDGG